MSDKPYSLNSRNNQSLRSQIIVEPVLRTNLDVKKWRYALMSAEDIENPDRSLLYDIYKETVLDGMITSATQRILLKCTNSKIAFVKEGQADKEHPISKMIQTPTFLSILKWIIESKWYGHSLIELEFKDKAIQEAHLISRKNVIPEKGIVVKRVGDQTGIDYKNPPYTNYVLDVGETRDLGLLNKATPYAIYKRFGFCSWGEFVERYGIPIQEYQYDPQIPGSKEEVKRQAKDQGSGARIVMPKGTTSKIHKGADGGGTAVFKEYKGANDEEILLIFLLQTMTTKDGSSRSQAEVHKEGGEDELIAGYKLFIEMVLNFQFKPILAAHGFDTEGGRFEYQDTEKLSKKVILEIIQGLSNFGDIPLEYIEKQFGIKLTPKEKETVKNALLENDKKKSRYYLNCNCDHEQPLLQLRLNRNEEDQLIERIFKAKGSARFDSTYFQLLGENLIDGFNEGWQQSSSIDYNSPDHLKRTLLELNLYRFSATKDIALLQELNKKLVSSQGFTDFKQEADLLLGQYNKNYLQTEYNLAKSTAQSTSNYLRNVESIEDFPYWEYQTVGDARVRSSHAALDGLLFPAGETGTLTTPNGHNCRCEYVPRASKDGKKLVTEADAIELMGKEYDKMKKTGFAVNRAEQGLVFSEDQMYLSRFKESNLSYKDFGLVSYSKIASNASKAAKVKRNEAEARQWFKSQVGKNNLESDSNIRLLDYNKRPVNLSLDKLIKNKVWELLNLLPDALKKPDEVYFSRVGKNKYQVRLLQYYAPKPLVIEMELSTKESQITAWGFAKNISEARSGLLIKKS